MCRLTLSTFLFLFAVGVAIPGEPITIGETIKIRSEILSEERTILVSTPDGYDQGGQRYPVLYLTDGDGHLTHTRGTVDFLVQNGLMPDVIIVGVTNTDRTRDLSPTRASITEDDGTVREFPTSGGAGTFLDFFEKELFPYIDGKYRTHPYRVFAGHSFGGLFALNAFFTRPNMFQSVIAASPSLRWDDALPLRQAEAFAKKKTDHRGTLFVTMANELEDEPKPDLLDRFEATLEKAKNKDVEWRVLRMPDETHGSVVLRTHYWGLRDAFEGWQLPRDEETGRFAGGLTEVRQHYASLSKRFGFDVVPPENTINALGYQLYAREDVDGAIEIFRYNISLYPDSANPYDSLGEALENAGRFGEAARQYSIAVENAKKSGDQRLSIFTANRDRAKAKVAEAADK